MPLVSAPIVGFAPDRPPTTPGVLVDCSHVVPTAFGMGPAPGAQVPSGVPALAAACRGAALAQRIDGTRRVLAGTGTRLYELVSGSWSDLSRAGLYSGGSDSRWIFTQFGNAAIATNDTEVIQASTTGAFADIATAPKARIVFTVGDFVMALDTNDGTYGDGADRWWCSGIFDHTTWTPSLSTQANTGRLLYGGGPIVSGAAFGRQAVAYKERAMFLGTYVGGSATWQWDQIPGDQGAIGPEAVCDANGLHFFVGQDNFWVFDGVRATPVGDQDVRTWFFTNSNPTFRYRTIVQYERQNNRVWVFFPSAAGNGSCDRALVFHMIKRAWGRSDQAVQAAFTFIAPGITIQNLNTLSATIQGLPEVGFNSQFWLAGGRSLAVVDGSNQPRTLDGAPMASTLRTSVTGDYQRASTANEVRPGWITQPTSATCEGIVFDNIGGASRSGGAASLYDGAFHLRQSGRWHQFNLSMSGAYEFDRLGFDLVAGGRR